MRTAVLDSSAIIRLFVPDGPIPEGLEECVEAAWRSEAIIMVPELALAEVAQVLRKKEKKGLISAGIADEILEAVLEMPLDVVGMRSLAREAMNLARETDMTVYDAIFLVLARSHHAELITSDARLARIQRETGAR